MRTVKALHHDRTDEAAEAIDRVEAYETIEIFRVDCPECGQPIALLADEESLPEHALCPTPWDPFGLTVCRASGRSAAEAEPTGGRRTSQPEDAAVLLTLPEGLDWRMQPFSHAGGPGARPSRVAGQHA